MSLYREDIQEGIDGLSNEIKNFETQLAINKILLSALRKELKRHPPKPTLKKPSGTG